MVAGSIFTVMKVRHSLIISLLVHGAILCIPMDKSARGKTKDVVFFVVEAPAAASQENQSKEKSPSKTQADTKKQLEDRELPEIRREPEHKTMQPPKKPETQKKRKNHKEVVVEEQRQPKPVSRTVKETEEKPEETQPQTETPQVAQPKQRESQFLVNNKIADTKADEEHTDAVSTPISDAVVTTPGPSTASGEKAGEPQKVRFGSAEGPHFRTKVLPAYPRQAKIMGKEGTVILELTIDDDGTLTEITVIKGDSFGFTEEAIKAVKESKFYPAKKNGRRTSCKAILPIRFVLR